MFSQLGLTFFEGLGMRVTRVGIEGGTDPGGELRVQ